MNVAWKEGSPKTAWKKGWSGKGDVSESIKLNKRVLKKTLTEDVFFYKDVKLPLPPRSLAPPSVEVLVVQRPSDALPGLRLQLEGDARAFRSAIEDAFATGDAKEAVSSLLAISAMLEELQALCTARLRLRLPVGSGHAPARPDWLEEQRASLGNQGVAPEALASACRLVAEVAAQLGEADVRASLEPESLGRVRVEWAGAHDLTWLVAPSELPWPGVSVRFYPPDAREAETLRLADDLVEKSVAVLK